MQKDLPDIPGVYLFKDSKGKIIYIGKAISLKKRVAAYFFKNRSREPKIEALIKKIEDVDYRITNDEVEALLLEAALVRKHQPKYNVSLRDDKNYPLLKISVNEKFPCLAIVRKKSNDGAKYFGPYTNAKLLRKAFLYLKRLFGVRTCRVMKQKVCLDYYIDSCAGPCEEKVSKEEYQRRAEELCVFLEGGGSELLARLAKRMGQASEHKDFEKAAVIRDRIEVFGILLSGSRRRMGRMAVLDELKESLSLSYLPERIEAFDVSNISGSAAVASMASFYRGEPDKKNYRRFNLSNLSGTIDDCKMMREVIQRRYCRLIFENKKPPDLIIADGGKGQLSAAVTALAVLGQKDIPVIGIAKKEEDIYIPGRKEPLRLPLHSKSLRLLQRIRNEAHRFAIAYHRKLRSKAH